MRLIYWFFLGMCSWGALGAQPWPLVQIAEGLPGQTGPCEPDIAIDPENPARMVAGSVLRNVYSSQDGGRSWTTARLESPLGVFGDPCLVADGRGHFYYFHLSDPDQKGWGSPRFLDRIVVQRSKTRSGSGWSRGESIGHRPPKQQDKEWVDVSADGKTLYCAWTEFDAYGSKSEQDRSRIVFSAGTQKGRRWTEPVVVSQTEGNCLDGDQTAEGATPAAGLGDAVYLTWALDGSLYFSSSADRGQTWTPERLLGTQVGGWSQDVAGFDRSNGMPVLVCDRSRGFHQGSLYLMYTEQKGSDIDVVVQISRDGGLSWSQAAPIHPVGDTSIQFMPWMCVDQSTGRVHAVYYDRHRQPGEESVHPWATHVVHAWSVNGIDWEHERLTTTPFVPSPQVFMGDYNAIEAVNGQVRPIWTELREGRLSVWTALIDMKPLSMP
ncbi:glycosyl hydrolase [bacterium]|nr:glycosyl hydrolase [bacterium]